jgi:hypothetical protein
VQEGKVPPFKKSEPIPEVNDEPVKVVVADSLDELVTKSGKNGTNNLQFCRVHQFFFFHYIVRLVCTAICAFLMVSFNLSLFILMMCRCLVYAFNFFARF